ncbi:unnamed protein product, partial [marine sediment metagenome]
DEDGNFEGAMAFVTDVTERKIAQEKIADMARFPLENPNPILRLSKKYVLLANKTGQTLFRIGEGSRIPEILIKSVNEAFSKDKNIEMELNIKDRIYNLFIVPIKGKEYANIYGMDITARKEAEDNLGRFVSLSTNQYYKDAQGALMQDRNISSLIFLFQLDEKDQYTFDLFV